MVVQSSQNGGANVELELHGKHRSSLQITMTVLGNGDNNGSPIDFQGTYSVTRGTGRAARAVGGGSTNGILDPQTQTITFDLQGKLSP